MKASPATTSLPKLQGAQNGKHSHHEEVYIDDSEEDTETGIITVWKINDFPVTLDFLREINYFRFFRE